MTTSGSWPFGTQDDLRLQEVNMVDEEELRALGPEVYDTYMDHHDKNENKKRLGTDV